LRLASNRHGGAIFVHDDWRGEKGIDLRTMADIPQAPIAPIEIRDFVYGRLINISPATLYPDALIAGEKGLLARGLNERHFGNYGGLPSGSSDRDRIARLLLLDINGRFPSAGSLRGVPGVWEDWQGTHLWKPKDYPLPRLLIPVRDGSGRIQACQVRLPFATKKGLRYLWLSSSDLSHGTGSGSPFHFKFRLADLPRAAWIVIVEGVLLQSRLVSHRGEKSNGTVLATRSSLTGSNRPVPRARTAAQETVVRRASAPAHARALRRNMDRR